MCIGFDLFVRRHDRVESTVSVSVEERRALRNLHAHTEFKFVDFRATEEEKKRVIRNFRCYYTNERQLIEELRDALTEDLFLIVQKEYTEVDQSGIWNKFFYVPEAAEGISPTVQADQESFLNGSERQSQMTLSSLSYERRSKKPSSTSMKTACCRALSTSRVMGICNRSKSTTKETFAGGTHIVAGFRSAYCRDH